MSRIFNVLLAVFVACILAGILLLDQNRAPILGNLLLGGGIIAGVGSLAGEMLVRAARARFKQARIRNLPRFF